MRIGSACYRRLYAGCYYPRYGGAYAAIGNGGTYYEPYCYYKVTNSSGSETLLQTSVKGEKVLSPDTADVVCELLQANTNYGTTKAAAVSGFQTMAKTGTTTDEKDRWFAAGTPYYVSATWYAMIRLKPFISIPTITLRQAV